MSIFVARKFFHSLGFGREGSSVKMILPFLLYLMEKDGDVSKTAPSFSFMLYY